MFAKAGTNCDKLAEGVERFLADHERELANTDAFESANPAAQDDLEAKMQDKAKQFVQTASASMEACQDHARVIAALDKLPD